MILSDAREGARAADATNCPLNAPAKGPARNRAGLFVVPVPTHLVSTEKALEADEEAWNTVTPSSNASPKRPRGAFVSCERDGKEYTLQEIRDMVPGDLSGIGGDNDANKEEVET